MRQGDFEFNASLAYTERGYLKGERGGRERKTKRQTERVEGERPFLPGSNSLDEK